MNILKDTAYPVDQTGYPNFSITAITVICPIVPVKYNLIAFFLSTELSMSSSFVSQNMYNSFTLLRQQIEPNQIHLIKQIPETRINTGFRHFNPLFKLFFWFTFSRYFSVIVFQNRIILIRFCILLMWLQSCCIQIVPRIAYKPKLVFTLLNNTPAFIRFL